MEDCRPLKSDNRLKHRPLTPIRVFRGLLCLLVYISTAFMFLVYFGPIIAFMLRLFSIHYCRKATSFLFGLWLAMWPFLFEKINRTKIVFSGNTVPAKERVLLIANHRTEVDWMYLWNLALRKGCLGYIKYILKSTLMKLPVFGWGFHILEFISVERKWEIDELVMHQILSTFKNPQDPLWLAIFPEGTDFTQEKCKRSQKLAAEVGLPVLTNVLLPKTRGFFVCLETLRDSLDAVYDVTIAYKHQCPSFLDNVFGVDPSEVHIHVRRIPVKELPTSDSEVGEWLMDAFHEKDQLLSDFKAQESIAGSSATVFTLQNQCSYTIWPGTLCGNGIATLGDGGFSLAAGASVQFPVPQAWSGRIWARTGCNFDASGNGKCVTGDCGGLLKCSAGGAPPVSLAEFTIGKDANDKDFYDVSLVDGYNVGLGVKAVGGSGDCRYAGCVTDLKRNCPTELQVMDSGSVVACKSACAAFNTPQFCCTGDHATPQTCSPTQYSKLFKNACPTAYSYAYDDATSTFTCSGSDYVITFCPS